jgi:hypothetical protein
MGLAVVGSSAPAGRNRRKNMPSTLCARSAYGRPSLQPCGCKSPSLRDGNGRTEAAEERPARHPTDLALRIPFRTSRPAGSMKSAAAPDQDVAREGADDADDVSKRQEESAQAFASTGRWIGHLGGAAPWASRIPWRTVLGWIAVPRQPACSRRDGRRTHCPRESDPCRSREGACIIGLRQGGLVPPGMPPPFPTALGRLG